MTCCFIFGFIFGFTFGFTFDISLALSFVDYFFIIVASLFDRF